MSEAANLRLGTDPSLLKLTTSLRIGLAVLVLLVGTVVPDDRVQQPAYSVIGLVYLAGAVAWRVVLPRLAVPGTLRIVGPAADVVFLVVLAALSGGPTSLLQPVFFLLPVIVAFFGLPRVTAALGGVVAAAYLVVSLVWSDRQAPPAPVVWLHFGFLIWLAAGSTAVSLAIMRRERRLRTLQEQQRNLVAQSLRIEEQERATLAERLHDGPLQVLLATRMSLDDIADQLVDFPAAAAELRVVKAELAEAGKDIRATVSGLHPQVLAQLGLPAALRELAEQLGRRTGATVELDLDPAVVRALMESPAGAVDTSGAGADPHPQTGALLYSVARELLTNVAKHANAEHVRIMLHQKATGPGALVLTVADDGIGFDPAVLPGRIAAGHIGLGTRAARVTAAGGDFTISSDKTGTTVTVTLGPGRAAPSSPERG